MVGKGWGDEVVRGSVGHLRRVGGVAGMIDGEDVDSAGAGEDDVLGRLGHESRRADKEDAGGIDTLLSVATPTGGNRWRERKGEGDAGGVSSSSHGGSRGEQEEIRVVSGITYMRNCRS